MNIAEKPMAMRRWSKLEDSERDRLWDAAEFANKGRYRNQTKPDIGLEG
jgi:hypothetical protein